MSTDREAELERAVADLRQVVGGIVDRLASGATMRRNDDLFRDLKRIHRHTRDVLAKKVAGGESRWWARSLGERVVHLEAELERMKRRAVAVDRALEAADDLKSYSDEAIAAEYDRREKTFVSAHNINRWGHAGANLEPEAYLDQSRGLRPEDGFTFNAPAGVRISPEMQAALLATNAQLEAWRPPENLTATEVAMRDAERIQRDRHSFVSVVTHVLDHGDRTLCGFRLVDPGLAVALHHWRQSTCPECLERGPAALTDATRPAPSGT